MFSWIDSQDTNCTCKEFCSQMKFCREILGQNFVYQTQMTLNKWPLSFLFREKSAWIVSCLLLFCFTSSVSSKRGKCQVLLVWGIHASLRHYWNQSWCCLKLQELEKHQPTDPHGEKKKNAKRKTPSLFPHRQFLARENKGRVLLWLWRYLQRPQYVLDPNIFPLPCQTSIPVLFLCNPPQTPPPLPPAHTRHPRVPSENANCRVRWTSKKNLFSCRYNLCIIIAIWLWPHLGFTSKTVPSSSVLGLTNNNRSLRNHLLSRSLIRLKIANYYRQTKIAPVVP